MAHYGGLNLRLATPASQEITTHTDASNAVPRRAWSDLSGVFGAAATPSGVTLLQHGQNPDYPLRREQPLVLRYRLIIHSGAKPGEARANEWWDDYNGPSAALPEFRL